jgi:putative transposase
MALSRVLPRARWSCFVVKPETLLRWHRRLVAGTWTYPHHRPGRPALDHDAQPLIVRLARENPRWGYQCIKGELLRLGVQVSAIRTTLRRHGLDPAPRRTATTWRAFLRQQPPGSWRATSSPWTRSGCGGCRSCSSSNTRRDESIWLA